MTRAEILAELRAVLADTVEPYGWSDARLRRFLARGQDQFCQDTGFFRDATTYTITTVAGTSVYSIPARVIQVLAVVAGDTKHYGWRTDIASGSLTLYPIPDIAQTLQLRVWRKSLKTFGQLYEMEIPEDYHFAPIEYAAAKCLSDHDRELQDPVKAQDHMANYQTLVREGKRAFRRLCAGTSGFKPNPLYIV